MTLSQTTKKILINDPFYGFVLMSLDKQFTERIPTAGIRMLNSGYSLSVNEKFWNSLTDEMQVQILKHELLHVCFFHLTRRSEFENLEIANIAMDAEINQYLDLKILNSVPGGCIDILAEYPQLQPKAGTRYYYDFLIKQSQKSKGNPQKPCNGGSGGMSSCGMPVVSNHDTWEAFDKLTDVQKDLLKNKMNYILVEAATQATAKGRGTIPGELLDYINNLLKPAPPVFNWTGYVRRLIGNAEEYHRKGTRKRESKRFAGAVGTRHVHKSKILVAIDTSGSVNTDELKEFFTEINHICKTGTEVYIVECDATIARIYRYKGNFDGTVAGRGGTSFDPAIEYYNENRREYNTLVYFTDGGAPLNTKVLGPSIWIITSNGLRQDYPGVTVYIPKKNED